MIEPAPGFNRGFFSAEVFVKFFTGEHKKAQQPHAKKETAIGITRHLFFHLIMLSLTIGINFTVIEMEMLLLWLL
ncbi:hypothetical protein KNH48_07085 [Heyndrickxia coagulans]|nr:hypothetical protein KNH48_07085 [Heyndrickxia coagulans]